MTEKRDKIYWHDAFYGAVQLELANFKEDLHFESEYRLGKEALRMDVLIVKKEKNVEIQKNFGRIFKEHNILEYKSEQDYVSVYDYNKVTGYALVYSAFKKAPTEDITLTFVTAMHPKKLFRYLKDNGHNIVEAYSGIYYIHGGRIDCQVLVMKRLPNEENLFIKSLRSNLSAMDIKNLMVAYKKQGESEEKNIFINTVINANARAIREVSLMSKAEVDMILREAMEKRGWLREWEEKMEQQKLEMERKAERERQEERQKMIRRMIEDGVPLEKAQEWTGCKIAR